MLATPTAVGKWPFRMVAVILLSLAIYDIYSWLSPEPSHKAELAQEYILAINNAPRIAVKNLDDCHMLEDSGGARCVFVGPNSDFKLSNLAAELESEGWTITPKKNKYRIYATKPGNWNAEAEKAAKLRDGFRITIKRAAEAMPP
ncbi:hypothetical protein [Roseateles sp.]|uniref:hypothetical protein n=1 Tax=Roseateles sp. TaxID=1971397 RepID=UPI003BA707AA